MLNDEIYATARQNLLNKKQRMGFEVLETCCYGHLKEYELEWHRRKGGSTAAETAMIKYSSRQSMKSEMEANGCSISELVALLGWEDIADDVLFRNGDLKVSQTSTGNGGEGYGLYFYNNGLWEVSIEGADRLLGRTSVPNVVRTLRKREADG